MIGDGAVRWHRVLAADALPEGRVTTVAAGHKSVALVHFDGQYSALDNRCPHQGGPLGEGSIENGLPGKIAKEQRAGEWDVWQTTLHNPDFSAFARNCGAMGIRVTDRDELDAALAEAVAHDGPAMVEVITDPDLV